MARVLARLQQQFCIAHRSRQCASIPSCPSKLEETINKALEKDRKLRYQNATDIRTDLQRLKRDSDSVSATATTARVESKAAKSTWWWMLSGATVLLIALAIGARLFYSPKVHALTDKDTIVLADFTNTTGNTVFDGTLRQGLSVQLEQSPFLSIISDQQIQQTLSQMGQPADAKLTPPIARELCQRAGSTAVIDGSIGQIGTQYLLTLKAVNCESGRSLASTEAQASDQNHVLDALGKMSVDLRNKLGESLSTVQKFDTPLEQATTPSLEALKAYSSGIRAMTTTGSDAAIPHFKRAIELDPNFAVAYAYLGVTENDILESGLAMEYHRKAYELRDRSSEAEKYWITAGYQKAVTGNIEKAIETCRLWIEAYPRSEAPHVFLAGAVLSVVGEIEKAFEEATIAIQLNPKFGVPYFQRLVAALALNRLDEAKATYAQAQERNLDYPLLYLGMYELAFLENDAPGMAKHAAKVTGHAGMGRPDAGPASRYGSLFWAPQGRPRALAPRHGFRRTRTREGPARNVPGHVWTERGLVRQHRGSAVPCRSRIEALVKSRCVVFFCTGIRVFARGRTSEGAGRRFEQEVPRRYHRAVQLPADPPRKACTQRRKGC